jgi:hypothetical protein
VTLKGSLTASSHLWISFPLTIGVPLTIKNPVNCQRKACKCELLQAHGQSEWILISFPLASVRAWSKQSVLPVGREGISFNKCVIGEGSISRTWAWDTARHLRWQE